MREFNKTISITPQIIDIPVLIPSQRWKEVVEMIETVESTPDMTSHVLNAIGRHAMKSGIPRPGSSILGILSVLPASMKSYSTVYTTRLFSNDGIENPLSAYFYNSLLENGLNPVATSIYGSEPMIVRILINEHTGERVFLRTANGPNDVELDKLTPIPTENTLFIVDSYELTKEKTRDSILNIANHMSPASIALSLGDQQILNSNIVKTIDDWRQKKLLAAVFGNQEEFQKLSSVLNLSPSLEPLNLAQNTSRYLGCDVIVTRGNKGIVAIINDDAYIQEAEAVANHEIRSTSGAGDSVMGIIIGGLATAIESPRAILGRSVQHAAHVVKSDEDILPYNWS